MRAKIPGAEPQKASPADYELVFGTPSGALVLEDLVQRFAGRVFVPGGLEGDRETCFRSGKREVVEFILRQMNRAAGVEPNEGSES